MAQTARLINTSKANAVIATDVRFSRTFVERGLGLMGREPLPVGAALYFEGSKLIPCNSIQTCFMRFSLDVIFLDAEMKVRKVLREVKPWRMTWPVAGAVNAIELTSGSNPAVAKMEIGDQLSLGVIGDQHSGVIGDQHVGT